MRNLDVDLVLDSLYLNFFSPLETYNPPRAPGGWDFLSFHSLNSNCHQPRDFCALVLDNYCFGIFLFFFLFLELLFWTAWVDLFSLFILIFSFSVQKKISS